MKREMNWMAVVMTGVVAVAIATWTAPARADNAGEATYKAKCAMCHGADGKGETAIGKVNKIRDLGSADVQKQTDEELSGIIGNGKAKMPGYSKSLKPEQIKELVAYIRTLKK